MRDTARNGPGFLTKALLMLETLREIDGGKSEATIILLVVRRPLCISEDSEADEACKLNYH